MGRFGPFVQIGTKDDADKPRFAGLRPGQKMDTLLLADAFELFKLPRTLGQTAEGETILTAIGRFGPYVKYGAKYVSLKEDDPYTVTLERALEVIQAKTIADANRIIQDFAAEKIQVLNGRYGPYVTDKLKNARIPKDRDPKTLRLEECQALLAAAPAKGSRGRFGRKFPAKSAASAEEKSADATAPPGAAPPVKAKRVIQTKAKAKSKAKPKAKATAAPKAGLNTSKRG
jgi:DNA topoisomerase-1